MTAGATSLDGKTMDPADSILAFGCANNPNPSNNPMVPHANPSRIPVWRLARARCLSLHVQTWEIGEEYV